MTSGPETGTFQDPTGDGLDGLLASLPAQVRADPVFRRGFLAGLDARRFAMYLDSKDEAPPREPEPLAPAFRTWGVTELNLSGRLSAGDVVVRETRQLGEGTYRTESPCCGRRIDAPRDIEDTPAVCCHCKTAAVVTLVQEEPDGYSDDPVHVAVFTITSTTLTVASHRTGRYESVG